MKTICFSNDCWPKLDCDIALCLGFFDGVHLGHKKIIDEAKRTNYKVAVLSFDKSYYEFSSKESRHLTSSKEKKSIFKSYGVNIYLEVKLDKSFLDLSKEDFVKKIVENISPKICICGEDYSFGKGKSGTAEFLKSQIKTKIVSFRKIKDKKISSRKIADLLMDGNVKDANKCLGYQYSLSGVVTKGLKNGRKIGFPTANILLEEKKVAPKEGVYSGKAIIGKREFDAIASYGTHPSVDKLNYPILEVHILEFKENIYGKKIIFKFEKFIRNNQKFNNLQSLKRQIEKDKKKVRH